MYISAGKKIAGIDPGVTGAIAIGSCDGEEVEVIDTPSYTEKKLNGKKKVINRGMFDLLGMFQLLAYARPAVIVIEEVNAFGLAGFAAFSLGSGYYAWLMAATALGIEIIKVTPQTWKKDLKIPKGSDKEVSRRLAVSLFPTLKEDLKLKKHHNRAEACLLLEYGRRHCGYNRVS